MLPKVIQSESAVAQLRFDFETWATQSLCTSMNTGHPGWSTKMTQTIHKGRNTMKRPKVIRDFAAIAAIAMLLPTTYQSSAAELHPLVVTGIALDRVATQHPILAYPQLARSLRIQGDVRVRIEVENGKMLNVTAKGNPMLVDYTCRWIRSHWQFRPTISGVYYLPFSYKLTA
jgi:Gram-negative bacterial TonB protein C-terminal